MKKILLKAAIGLAVLLVLGVLTVSLFLDATLKRAVETLGPKLAKVDINLDNVSLSLLSGSGAIHGLAVGNPEGFKTPHAIRVASASLAVKPRSLFADKIVIKSIVVDAAEITFEGGFGGNNLSKILSNVESATGPGKTNAAAQPAAQKPGYRSGRHHRRGTDEADSGGNRTERGEGRVRRSWRFSQKRRRACEGTRHDRGRKRDQPHQKFR